MKLKVSIVVPVYNEQDMLTRCLDSLMALDYPKDLLEIILIDNNSTDLSASIIRKYPVTCLFESRKGSSCARNAGIRIATGEIIVFTDADCVVDSDWIKNMLAGFKTLNTGCCGGKTVSYDPQNIIEQYFDWLFENQSKTKYMFMEEYFIGPIFATCNLACRREVFDAVGLFDEDLVAAEDTDLVWKINLKGYQLNYIPEALVRHKRRNKLCELPRIFILYMYRQYWIVKKFEKITGISFDWLNIFMNMIRYVFLSVVCILVKFDMKESVFSFLMAVLTFSRIVTAVYGWFELLILKRKTLSVLTFAVKNVIWRWDGKGDVLILNLKKKYGFKVTGIGARVWEQLYEGKMLENIISDIGSEYAVEKNILKDDVIAIIDEFKEEGLLY
jgi:GT2 family glycosyltransferase